MKRKTISSNNTSSQPTASSREHHRTTNSGNQVKRSEKRQSVQTVQYQRRTKNLGDWKQARKFWSYQTVPQNSIETHVCRWTTDSAETVVKQNHETKFKTVLHQVGPSSTLEEKKTV